MLVTRPRMLPIDQTFNPGVTINRRKKINHLLKAHQKKAAAKLAPKSKPKYICKADRLKMEAQAAAEQSTVS